MFAELKLIAIVINDCLKGMNILLKQSSRIRFVATCNSNQNQHVGPQYFAFSKRTFQPVLNEIFWIAIAHNGISSPPCPRHNSCSVHSLSIKISLHVKRHRTFYFLFTDDWARVTVRETLSSHSPGTEKKLMVTVTRTLCLQLQNIKNLKLDSDKEILGAHNQP